MAIAPTQPPSGATAPEMTASDEWHTYLYNRASWGAIVAVYFLATGITGLTMLGIPLWVTNVFNGGALILAVTISQLTRGREASDIG